jgi:acyl-CoA synthetase (AMP-forming)/AMP-acid ligase II
LPHWKKRLMNLASMLTVNAASRPAHPAVVASGVALDHRGAAARMLQLAAWLAAAGVRPGDRIGLRLTDTPDHLLLHYALAWLGAILVPIDHRWTEAEAARVATAMRTSRVIASVPETLPEADPPPMHEGGDAPFVLSLSSGTTGLPTGAVVTHAQLYERFVSQWVTLGFHSGDRFLLATPLYFGGGRSFAMSFLAAGGTVIFCPPPAEPEQLLTAALDATVSFLVPTQVRRLLAAHAGPKPALSSLRLLVTSGSAVHAAERAAILTQICPQAADYYASSEGGGIAVLHPEEQLAFPDSVGRPIFRVEVEIVDQAGMPVPAGMVGRLRYRGPGVCRRLIAADGTEHDPTDSGGWFEPGDLARRLPSGHLVLAGRSKDVINRAGVNIYPSEIEATLCGLAAVQDAVVVGLPDSELGERPAALVVAPGATAEALQSTLAECLAPYKRPSPIVLAEALPRTGMNKIDRARAREVILGTLAPTRPRNRS